MTMENDANNPGLEQIAELPLDERAAAFNVLEREIRERLDERPN